MVQISKVLERGLFFCCGFTLLALLSSAALAADGLAVAPQATGSNLIPNPSFENDRRDYKWNQNNWAKHDAEFVLDTDNPHSGKYCQRIRLIKVKGAERAEVAFFTPHLPVRPGMSLQLRFWMRGPANMRPIDVVFQKSNPPWTNFFFTQVDLTPDWRESVFNLTPPTNTDPNDTVLRFNLREENTYWLDDVSLVELPVQEGGTPLVGNRIKNGSFEVGRDHWYATFRESGARNALASEKANIDANIVAVPEKDAPAGHNVLSFEVFKGCSINLTSAYFHLRYGHPATISFWLKTTAAGKPFNAGLGQGKFPSQIIDNQTFKPVDSEWHQYRMLMTPQPSTSHTYFFGLGSNEAGRYELDGVSVMEGDVANPAFEPRSIEMGWKQPGDAPAGNLFYSSDAIHFPLVVTSASGSGTRLVHLRVVNYQEKEVKKWDISVPLDATGSGTGDVVFPSDKLGGFKVEAFAGNYKSGEIPDADVLYSVVPRLKAPGEVADSFFGCHCNLSPYNLEIAKRLGVRWLRLHPPIDTKWLFVEPEKGKFELYTEGVARAHQMGFRVLGDFDTTPPFYSQDPSQPAKWFSNPPPANWDAWRNYVRKTATAFGPYVDAWEIWNEPDGGFLRVQPGQNKEEVYLKIVQETRKALDDAGIKTFLIGNVVASLERPFGWKELELGGGKQVDALSFHLYYEDHSPEEKRPALSEQLAKMRSYKNRSGETPDLWCTESGMWLSGGRSWLDSVGIPPQSAFKIDAAANMVTRSLAACKAMGIKRFFYYCAMAMPSGRIVYRDDCSGMIDVSGVPHAAGAAYAAAVYFLENAEADGLEVLPLGDGSVTIAKFKKANVPLTVVWSRRAAKLGQIDKVAWKNAAGFDMMGNPLALSEETPVTLDPLYLVGKTPGANGSPVSKQP